MLAKFKQHRLLVVLRQHVDEIGHHDAAQIAQTQLARNRTRRFEVGFEDGFVKVARTHVATGVDINGGQGLGLIDHQIAPRFQVHTPAQGAADLVIDRKQIKDGPLTLVQLQLRCPRGHELRTKGQQGFVLLFGVDADALRAFADQVSEDALQQIEIAV